MIDEIGFKLNQCKTKEEIKKLFLKEAENYRDNRSKTLINFDLSFYDDFLEKDSSIDYLKLLNDNDLTVSWGDCEKFITHYIEVYLCRELKITNEGGLHYLFLILLKERSSFDEPSLYKNKMAVATNSYFRHKNLYQIFLKNYCLKERNDPYEIINILQRFFIVKDRKNGFKYIFERLFFNRADNKLDIDGNNEIKFPKALDDFDKYDDYFNYVVNPLLYFYLIQKDGNNENLLKNFCKNKGNKKAHIIEDKNIHVYNESETVIRSLKTLFDEKKIDKIIRNNKIKDTFK